jgi:type I restriction enzyme, R subunit
VTGGSLDKQLQDAIYQFEHKQGVVQKIDKDSRQLAEGAIDQVEAEVFRAIARRGYQKHVSFFAFTATPKHKTFGVFGRNGEPFHRYTMRQAIEEGFSWTC